MQKFSYSKLDSGPAHGLAFVGYINETAQLEKIEIGNISELHLSLEKVTGINSAGVKSWICWIEQIRKSRPEMKILFHKCPSQLIYQFNSIRNFIPEGSRIESFYVPYYNSETGQSMTYLFERGTHYQYSQKGQAKWVRPPEASQLPDGQGWEIDVPPLFFNFIT